MAVPDRRLRLDARSLLAQPGLERTVEVDLDAVDLGIHDERIVGQVVVRLAATSNLDGVVVRGSVVVPWRAACRRCLVDAAGSAVVEIDELYQVVGGPAASDDAFPIEGDQIDLFPAVRETVLLELPEDVLCSADCAGICPHCGTDRNVSPCSCDPGVSDDRWAVLDQLRLDPSVSESGGDGG